MSSADTFKISLLTPSDASELSDLAKTTFWDAFHHHPKNDPQDMAAYMEKAFNAEQMSLELADSSNIFVICRTGNNSAGYAKLILGQTEDGIYARSPIELSRLYIHQEFLGSGIGQRLMDKCFEIAITKGCDLIWLGVWEHNPRAQQFYLKNGFKFCGKHVFQLGSDAQTDLLMKRAL